MFRRLLIATLSSLGFLAGAGASERSLVRFDAPVRSVDTVRFDSGAVTLQFPFENVSGKEVTILEVRSVCGCLTGEVSRRVVPAGGRGVVSAVFNPSSLYGRQDRHLTIVTTDGERTILNSLTVKAYVLRDETEGEIRFAEDLGGGLRTERLSYALRRDRSGDYVLEIPLYNDTDAPMTLEISGPQRLTLYVPEEIPPRSRVDLRGVYDPLWLRRGRTVSDTLRLTAGGQVAVPLEFHSNF